MYRVVLALLCWSTVGSSEAVTLYVVQKGDTCIQIATRELGERRGYKEIHRLNPWLGKLPHRLQPGQKLLLPAKESTPDARLTEKNGNVEFRKSTERDWNIAKTGMDLFRRWRVGARNKSAAEVTFSDESKIRMRENTTVIIYGASRTNSRVTGGIAHLESGSLRARLKGEQRLDVTTESTEAELVETNTVVSVPKDGATRVANQEGKAIAVRGRKRKKQVSVAVGFGTKIKKGEDPEPPRPLPPAPRWGSVASQAVSLSETGNIQLEWSAVKNAGRYRFEIFAEDDLFPREVRFVEENGVELRELPIGKFRVKVAAIDKDEFEGPVSAAHVVEMRKLSVKEVVPGTNVMYQGTRIVPPAGVDCGGGVGLPVTLVQSGERQLNCEDAAGKAILKQNVKVTALPIKFDGPRSVRAGKGIRLVLSSAVPLSQFELKVDGGHLQGRENKGNKVELLVVPQKTKQLTLQVTTASGEVTKEYIVPIETRSPYKLGVWGTYRNHPSNYGLGEPTATDFVVGNGSGGGVEFAYTATPLLELGVGVNLMRARPRNGFGGATLLIPSVNVHFHPFGEQRWSPFLVAKGQWVSLDSGIPGQTSESVFEAGVGGGLDFNVDRARLRLRVVDSFGKKVDDSLAHSWSAALGVFFEL